MYKVLERRSPGAAEVLGRRESSSAEVLQHRRPWACSDLSIEGTVERPEAEDVFGRRIVGAENFWDQCRKQAS